jgi:hypothetical protein
MPAVVCYSESASRVVPLWLATRANWSWTQRSNQNTTQYSNAVITRQVQGWCQQNTNVQCVMRSSLRYDRSTTAPQIERSTQHTAHPVDAGWRSRRCRSWKEGRTDDGETLTSRSSMSETETGASIGWFFFETKYLIILSKETREYRNQPDTGTAVPKLQKEP